MKRVSWVITIACFFSYWATPAYAAREVKLSDAVKQEEVKQLPDIQKEMEQFQSCIAGDSSILPRKVAKTLENNRKEALDAVEMVRKKESSEVILEFVPKVHAKLQQERASECQKAIDWPSPEEMQ